MADAEKYPSLNDASAIKSIFDDISSLRDCGICEIIRDGIPYLEDCPSYEEFFIRFLLPNKPCLLSPKATARWQSCKDWVCKDGKPNIEFLQQHFGQAVVPVANCGEKEYGAHPKQEMFLRDYLQYLTADPTERDQACKNCLYLKDWHFARSFPDYTAYETPVYFRSDWLNEFWDTQFDKPDDYKFVYMGPKGSWTPLHADVMRSYSWSANVCGRKKWILFPPGEEETLKDRFGQLVFDVTSSELRDQSVYPNYRKLQHQFEVIQEAGEIIFVPSGWHHQVMNLEDTISINHNWFNGCNIDICWEFIKQSLADVKREIDDCRSMDGWHQQCQLILKSSLGTDFVEFYCLLLSIAQHRLKAIGCQDNSIVTDPLSLDSKQSRDPDTTNCTTDILLVSKIKISSFDSHMTNELSSNKNNPGDSVTKSSKKNSADKNVSDCVNTSKTLQGDNGFKMLGVGSGDRNAAVHLNDSRKECSSHSDTDTSFKTVLSDLSNKSQNGDYCLDLLIGLSPDAERKVNSLKKSDKNSQEINSELSQVTEKEVDPLKTMNANSQETDFGVSQESDTNLGLAQKLDINSGLTQETLKDGLSQDYEDNLNRLQQAHWRFCSKRHVLFDLYRVKDIVVKMTQDEDWKQMDTSCLSVSPETLLEKIMAITENSK